MSRVHLLTLSALAACGGASEPASSEPLPRPTSVVAPARLDVLPNLDNDDDFVNAASFDDDELVDLVVRLDGVPAKSLRIDVDGSDYIRVWHDGEIIVEDTAVKASIPWPEDGALRLKVEVGEFDVGGSIEISARDADDNPVTTAVVEVRSPPLLLNHHLQPARHVMATELHLYGRYDNEAFLRGFARALGDRFTAADGWAYGQDPWMQDEIEFAYAATPDGRTLDTVIDSIRDRGLDDYPENEWRGEGFGVSVFGRGVANSLDSFGNLEATPPIDGFPFGRIYYGSGAGYAPRAQALFNFLDEVAVQAPFEVDTTWLCVGHVDEFMTFLPDPSAPRGFRFVINDVDAAWDVLEAMDPATPLPRYAGRQNHNYATVGDIVADEGLRALNADIAEQHLAPILEQMTRELGLTPDEIIRMPGLFEEPSYCGRTVAALIPGMINLTVADVGEGPQVFMADPFLRADLADPASDPMIARVTELLPPQLDLHFIDDWEIYHLGLGEVHCGSNVVRSPSGADWWTDDFGGSR